MSDLPDGWEWVETGNIAEVQGGIQKQPKRRPVANKYPFLRVANVPRGRLDLDDVHEIELFDGEIERYRLLSGDLLVVEGNGSPEQIGRAAQWRGEIENCVHQNHLIRVRPSGAINPSYLAYYWNAPRTTNYLRSVASSTSGLHVLTASKVRGVRIPLAPLDEQARIVAAIDEQLSRLDAGLAALDRVRRNAKRALRSLAAMASTAKTSEAWRQVILDDVARIDSGPAFASARFGGPGEGIKLLRGDNIEPGALRWVHVRTWPADEARELEHLLVDAGDLILGMDRPVISTGFKLAPVRPEDLPALLVQRVARIRPKAGVDPRFLHIALQSPRFVPHVMRSQTGTQIPHITLAGIRSFPLALPSLHEQIQIAEEFEAFSDQLAHAERSALTAATRTKWLRGSILTAAFSGQLISQGSSR